MESSNSTLPYQVGIVGTFDVENYGDLLFPLIAERQLRRRLEGVNIIPFSPNARSQDQQWPINVNSTSTIKDQLPFLSALLIGGGQIVRFDPGYPVPVDANINLPIDYWFTPAVMATAIGKPVIWNAVGAWTGSAIPYYYEDLLKTALSQSALVAVRDQASQAHLNQLGPTVQVELIPDTAFSLATLWPNINPSKQYRDWCEALKLDATYVVLQADKNFEPHLQEITELLISLKIKTVVVLPVCRCHGDDSQTLQLTVPFNIIRADWLNPVLIAEVISHSNLVIASSLHACISAICYGITCIRIDSFNHHDRKFEIVNGFNNICRLNEKDRIKSLYTNNGCMDPRANAYADLLEQYWDRVAAIIKTWNTMDGTGASAVPALNAHHNHHMHAQDSPHICILLATYNGEKFLAAQLESIEKQTHHNWRIVISDDGSSDNTLKIAAQFQMKWGAARLEIRKGPEKGFVENFLTMACDASIRADLYAFCDQDDFWLPNKLERAVAYFHDHDNGSLPVTYGSRTIIADENLNHLGLSPEYCLPTSFRNAIVQSITGGNTQVFNQKTKELLEHSGPQQVATHDWWLYQLTKGAGGIFYYDPVPSLLYRQHPDALIGANSSLKAKIGRILNVFSGTFKQSNDSHYAALCNISHLLTKDNQDILRLYGIFRKAGLKDRIRLLGVCGLYRQTRLSTFYLWLATVFNRV